MNQPTCSACTADLDIALASCASCGQALDYSGTTLVWDKDETTSPSVIWQTADALSDPVAEHRSIAHYRIIERLGQGGMGAVYLAHEEALSRFLAIKVVRHKGNQPERDREQLLEEARKVARLDHPNIVRVMDVARRGELGFIAMEWVDGAVLSELLPDGGMDPERAGTILDAIAAGLEHAHTRGIVHGDLKPGNLMIDRQGTVKILDFGLAQTIGNPVSRHADAELRGTPAFMAPEQIRGEPAGTHSDIFGMGLVAFHLLTGRHPFGSGKAKEVMSSIATASPLPLAQFQPDLDPAWQDWMSRCLAKDPNDRFKTMASLRKALPASEERGTKTNTGRYATWRPLAALTLVFSLALAAVLWWPSPKAVEAEPEPPTGLAILPFENPSGDPLLRVYGDGLAVLLSDHIAGLAQNREDTWVVPASALTSLRALESSKVSQSLGVNRVITGRLTLTDATIETRLTLLQTPEGTLIANALLRFPQEDLFTGQQKVVAQALSLLGWPEPDGSPPVTPSLSKTYAAYLRGRGYLYRNEIGENVVKAREAFEHALEVDPQYAPAIIGLGDAHYLQWTLSDDPRWLAAAGDRARQALNQNPYSVRALITLGRVLLQRGEYEKAQEVLKRAHALEPANARAGYALAHAYYQMKRWEDAEQLFLAMLKRYPNDWLGHRSLGTFYFRGGRYEEAADAFRVLINLAPANNAGYYNLAGALLAQGKYLEALEVSRQSLQVAPTAWAHNNMGTALFYLERYEQAAGAFEKATKMRPNHYLTWGNLADAYRWSSDLSAKAASTYAHALSLLDKELQIHPDDPYHRSSQLLYLAKSGQLEQAWTILRESSPPDDVQLMFERAQIYELLGDRALALTQLEQALKGGFALINVHQEPELESLRSDPRFGEMLAGIQAN